MISGVRHTGIVVKNIKDAINFWVELMGFEIVSEQIESGEFIDHLLGLENVIVQTVKLAAIDRTFIELLNFKSHSHNEFWEGSPYSKGLTHIALNTSNISEITERLISHGYLPINNVKISPDGKYLVCYVRTFEGLLLELVETIKPPKVQ